MFELLITLAVAHQSPDLTADARYPLVRIADAAEFNILPHEAREAWNVAGRHIRTHEAYLLTHYTFGAVAAWRAEAEQCKAAWDALDNVLTCSPDRLTRLAELDRLRRIVGDADYHARKMPPPCPGHRFRD